MDRTEAENVLGFELLDEEWRVLSSRAFIDWLGSGVREKVLRYRKAEIERLRLWASLEERWRYHSVSSFEYDFYSLGRALLMEPDHEKLWRNKEVGYARFSEATRKYDAYVKAHLDDLDVKEVVS